MSEEQSQTEASQKESIGSHTNSAVLSVEQLNLQIRQTLEGQLGIFWVKAEISNFKPHSSGHFYFSLKDNKSQISAIMFRGHNSKLKFKPQDGLEVIVRGRISVYEPRGTYQIVCEAMEPVGAGALQKQFELLKEKLKKEGLFDQSRKKQIPAYPQHVAVVTSPTGAAIQDILNIMKRRARSVRVTLVPALVQGGGAVNSICDGLMKAQQLGPDVIIIGRGGGSIEDLWSFNDEKLARLVADCPIPVISAVGHEIDFTICDFVADLRAPTPSAAAELVAKSSIEINQRLTLIERNLKSYFLKSLQIKTQKLTLTSKRLIDPKKKLMDFFQRNDELRTRLEQAIFSYFSHLKKDVQVLSSSIESPIHRIRNQQERVANLNKRLNNLINTNFEKKKYQLVSFAGLLDSLSPLKVVERGFSIVSVNGKLLRSVKEIKNNDQAEIQTTDGKISGKISEIIVLEKR